MKERTKAVIQKVLSDNIPKDIAKPKSRNKDNYPSGADRFFLTDPPFMEYQVDQYHKNMLKESKTKKIAVEKAPEKKKIVGSARKDEAARTVRKDAPESADRKSRQEIVAENADMLKMLARTKEQGAEMKMDVLRSIKKEKGAEQKMQKEAERNGMGGRVRRKREKLVAKTSEKEEEEEEQMSMQKAKKRKMEKVKVKKSLELNDIMDIKQEKPEGGAGGI